MSSSAPCPPPLPRKRGRGWRIAWISLLTLLIAPPLLLVLWTIFGLFIWTGSMILVGGRGTPGDATITAQRYRCQANLNEIALIKDEWITAHNGKQGDRIPAVDLEKIFAEHEGKLICPLDPNQTPQTSYEIGPIGTDPKCKFQAKHEQKPNEPKKKKGAS